VTPLEEKEEKIHCRQQHRVNLPKQKKKKKNLIFKKKNNNGHGVDVSIIIVM